MIDVLTVLEERYWRSEVGHPSGRPDEVIAQGKCWAGLDKIRPACPKRQQASGASGRDAVTDEFRLKATGAEMLIIRVSRRMVGAMVLVGRLACRRCVGCWRVAACARVADAARHQGTDQHQNRDSQSDKASLHQPSNQRSSCSAT